MAHNIRWTQSLTKYFYRCFFKVKFSDDTTGSGRCRPECYTTHQEQRLTFRHPHSHFPRTKNRPFIKAETHFCRQQNKVEEPDV